MAWSCDPEARTRRVRGHICVQPLAFSFPLQILTPFTTSTHPPHYANTPLAPTCCAQVTLLLPCAVLCAAGVAVPLTGGVLLARSVWEDAALSGRQLLAVLTRGSRPTELLAKRLAIVGGGGHSGYGNPSWMGGAIMGGGQPGRALACSPRLRMQGVRTFCSTYHAEGWL